jgi:hypothetical protein
MVATKRFSRQGLVISALCHLGLLAVVLLFARAAPPQEAIPPDAMQVEIVMPKEIPRYSGTPSTLRTSGTEQTAQSQVPIPKSEQLPTVPQPPKDQRQAQRDTLSKSQEPQTQPQTEPQTAPPQAKEPPLPPADAGQVATAQPDPPPPSAETTPDTADTAAKAAYLALAGGRLGGGFAAPPINSPLVGYDFTEPFRELVSTCGALPPGVSLDKTISITVRIFLNRDGTLTEEPKLLEPSPSPDQQTLMQSFASGLQKCQPYTMLPQDHYEQWKTLDLVVHPHNYLVQ